MATEDILIRYRADVSQLEGDINKVIQSQEELTAATKANTQEQQKSISAAEFAAKKRVQLLDQEKKTINELKDAQKKAFNGEEVSKFNAQIAQSEKRVQALGGSYKQAADNVQNSNQQILGGINKIGAAFGVAFTAEALIQFAQQAVGAFLEAEEQAAKLRFAVTSIGGEGEEALARLTKQAEDLAAVTFFGDDDITAAQAALSAFGLTADQIEGIIPKLADFAAVTGGTVTDAANTLGGALEGRAGEFKRFGIEVDAASTKAENLAQVSAGLAKQAGAAGNALNTAAGKAKDFKDQAGEFVEAIGEGIVIGTQKIGEFLQVVFEVYKEALAPLIDAVIRFKNVLVSFIPDAVINKIKEFFTNTASLKSVLEIAAIPLKNLVNILATWYNGLVKAVAGVSGLVSAIRVGFNEIGQTVTNVGGGISDVINGIADFDPAKIKAGLGKVKGAFTQAGSDIANAFNEGYNKTLKIAEGAEQQVEKTTKVVEAANEKIFKSDELRKKSTKELNAELEKQSKIQSNAARQNVESINKELEARKKQGDAAKKAGDDAAKAAEQFKKLIEGIDGEITKLQADLERRKIEIIPADSQKAQEDRIKALADLNEKAINDEIAGKIKLVQEDSKLTTEQKNQAIAKYEELKQARLNLAQFNEQNELNLISAAQIDRIEAAAKQLDDLNIEQALVIEADKVETANAAVAKSFEDLGKAVSKADFAAAKEAVTARTAALNQALTEENNINKTRIENARETELAKVKEGDAAEAERAAINLKYNNQIDNADKELNDKLAANNKELNDTIATETQRATDARIAQTFQVLDATKQLVSELTGLYDQFSEQRIAKIEEERDLALESIDAQIEQNAEYLEKRRISEEEAAANEKALLDEKVRLEAAAQKKIREEKRKQAILDKAAATFEIGLQTAIAIVAAQKEPPPLNAILTAIIAATSAAQLAAVAAQPIPYRKGSKDTGRKEHLARVGEEGEELVWMPANSKVLPAKQTRKYSDIIDAMYDNKLDDYVYKNYITPALMAQKEAKENQRAKSFAENMANSIVYNQAGLTPSDLEAQRKRGQYIRNVDEIAEAIAKKLPIRDIYRA